jgi:hypothetical protein
MALSDDQKRKIEEEEQYRSQLRVQPEKKKGIGWGGALIITFILVSLIVTSRSFSDNSSSALLNDEDLVGLVNYKDLNFSVTNQENVDWNSCHLTLNSDYHYPSTSFSDKVGPIKAGETVSVPGSQFAKKDGTRFNSFTIKPQSISIDCNGRTGFWKW